MDKNAKNIEVINYEAQHFLSSFQRFRDRMHVIDQSLCRNLFDIVSAIDNFLDSKPKEILLAQKDLLTVNCLNDSDIRRSFICKKCQVEIGVFDNIRAHLTSGRHTSHKNGRTKNGEITKKNMQVNVLPRKAKSLILGNLQAFFAGHLAVAKKLKTLPDYKVIENELLTMIRPSFPGQSVKLYLFGSRISGIGFTYSDLDIFVDIGDVFNNFENRASAETVKKLQTVQNLLQKNPDWSRLIAIQNARVPILKILHKPTSTNCDIGFSNSLGFCNTKLTQYLLELQPLAKAMCLFVKTWLERTRLSEHITTYSAILLIVFFLQMKKMLPTIQILQEGLEDPIEIGPWLATFSEKTLADVNISPAIYSLDNFKKQIKEFFTFCSTFDFEHNLISPYLGHTISMETLETSPQLPRYVNYVNSENESKEAKFKKTHMNVQDPFQLNHNVTKAVPAAVVLMLKQYFELSAKLFVEGTVQQPDDVENLKK